MKEPTILFLDIDGVLNSGIFHELLHEDPRLECKIKSFNDPRGFSHYVEKDKLEIFQKFVEARDAYVVGVSSWFTGFKDITKESQALNIAIAQFLGIEDRFLGTTRTTGGGLARGDAVLEMVQENNWKVWAVIDDAGSNMYRYPTRVISGRYGLHPLDLVEIGWQLDEMIEELECKSSLAKVNLK